MNRKSIFENKTGELYEIHELSTLQKRAKTATEDRGVLKEQLGAQYRVSCFSYLRCGAGRSGRVVRHEQHAHSMICHAEQKMQVVIVACRHILQILTAGL
jgi:hypothetical protein